jgi:multidrug efflux pump subunit AcrA (membrane-fusion protein)
MSKISYIKLFITNLIKKKPLISFYALLTILLAVIALVSYLGKPDAESEAEAPTPKPVSLYLIGQTATLTSQAIVEKSGLMTIVAQTAGIVTNLPVKEGVMVVSGQNVLLSQPPIPGLILPLNKRDWQKNNLNSKLKLCRFSRN